MCAVSWMSFPGLLMRLLLTFDIFCECASECCQIFVFVGSMKFLIYEVVNMHCSQFSTFYGLCYEFSKVFSAIKL